MEQFVPYKSSNRVITHQRDHNRNQSPAPAAANKRSCHEKNACNNKPTATLSTGKERLQYAAAAHRNSIAKGPLNASWPRNSSRMPLASNKRNDELAVIRRRKKPRLKPRHPHRNDAKSPIRNCKKRYKVPCMP